MIRYPAQPIPQSAGNLTPDPVQNAALKLQYLTGASYLLTEFNDLFKGDVPLQAYDVYLHTIMEAAGQPGDPILRILIEQYVMAHHKIARLNRMGALAGTPEAARAYDASSVSLTAELRRLALAIKAYREPTTPSHVTVVKQQNLALNQQVALVEERSRSMSTITAVVADNSHDTELTCNGSYGHVATRTAESQSASGCSRETQPVVATRAQRRGSGEAAAGGPYAPAVAAFHRPAIRNG